jgi:hypothetical protein
MSGMLTELIVRPHAEIAWMIGRGLIILLRIILI